MASTDSFTSWNPALRPNSEVEPEPTQNDWTSIPDDEPAQPLISEPSFKVVAQDDFTAQQADAGPTPNDWTSLLDNKSAQLPLSEPSSAGVPQDNISSQHVDAWFSEETGEENWLEESQPVADDDSTEAQAPETTETAETAGEHLSSIPPTDQQVDAWISEDTAEENWLGETPPVAGDDSAETRAPEATETADHETPLSINATAPKEFDWTADHTEGESALFVAQEGSDDPFDFMPPSDRTNSFPPVPPLDAPKYTHSRSLSRTQAEDVMAESENGDDGVFEGDEREPENDASATRYEEGVPLLSDEREPEDSTSATPYEGGAPLSSHDSSPHDTPEHAPEETNISSHIDNAFADEEDDFFNNIGDTASPVVSTPPAPWSLDRKSTMQAMGVENTLPLVQAPALAEADEDEEEAGAAVADVSEVPGAAPGLTDIIAEAPKADEEALAAKWSEVFADEDLDEDLLFDNGAVESKELDPAAFFGSDDEGFLEDVDEQTSSAAAPSSVPVVGTTTTEQPSSVQDRYTPQAPVTSSQPHFTPAAPYTAPAPAAPYQQPPMAQPPVPSQFGAPYGTPQPRPELPRAQSFADKAKGGYTSPYDLPMEVVKAPKKRASMQQLPRSSALNAPPLPGSSLRSTSMYHQGPPSSAGVSPVEQGSGPVPPAGQMLPPMLPPKTKEAFFEDLPMTSRPRPGSRQSRTSSPAPGPPGGHFPMHPPPMQAAPTSAPPAAAYQPAPPATTYQPAPPATTYQPAPAATTYQPAPPATTYQPAPAATYQPAPPATTYQPAPSAAAYQPAPSATAYEPAPPQAPAAGPSPGLAPAPNLIRSTSGSVVPTLVQPETFNPYGPVPAQHHPAPDASAPANKYSPAPAQNTHLNGNIPPAASGRYSPAPPSSRQPSASYAPAPHSAHSAPILPHQPRTSSPLAHFETTARRSGSQPIAINGEAHVDRRTSLPHQPSFGRVPSLPTTRELDEENEQSPPKTNHSGESQPPTVAESRYSPAPQGFRQTPPPPLTHVPGQATLSPPKRSPGKRLSYSPLHPQPAVPGESEFVPPPRSYSQSPGSMQRTTSGPQAPAAEPIRRPSSVQNPTSPKSSQVAAAVAAYRPSHRARAPSLTLSMIPPTDGRENDPLQRWKGVPVIAWGVGGTVITSFPKNVPRYGMNQPAPMIVRTPGELKVTHVKDLLPLEDRLAKFPGPLKGKSKKKETIAWLSTGIEFLGQGIPDLSYAQNPSHDDKRVSERLLLWKILRALIENDGVLEGVPAVQKAVRDILVPGLDEQNADDAASLDTGITAGSFHQQGGPLLQADAVDPAGIELMRKHLMVGDREKATWAAVDKRLWGHAMLIANTVSPDLYKQVAQEFVRKEVNHPGYSNESVAALYKVLSGSHEECVDELVPVHARAGLQLISTTTSANGPSKDALEGLDKWRETLCLILGNRSPDDARALIALGELLSTYGRAEAAHICFIFGRQASVFGGPDDPRSNFVLVGADHKRQGDHLFKDTEALLLSEVYEYGMSLAGGVSTAAPHLAAYKLQLAATLAEYGQQSRALEYCEAISSAVNAQTKRSPYYSPALDHAVHDFIGRLKQAPREESGSWIPKPSMNKVSDSMWSTFNKFVSGDDDGSGAGPHGENGAESGPFARVAGGTPNLSRSPSASNLDIYGASNMGYPGQPPAGAPVTSYPSAPAQPGSRSSSRYAPAPQQGAVVPNPYEAASSPYTPRTSGELARNFVPIDSSRPSTGYQQQQQYHPTPLSQSAPQTSPLRATSGYGMAPAQGLSYQPQAPATPPGSGYTPLGVQDSPYASQLSNELSNEPSAPANASGDNQPSYGYQAPSYGFEPPSMTAEPEEVAAADDPAGEQDASGGGYEAPSFQPYEYEPPSYEPDAGPTSDDDSKPKKGMMDDDEDDIPAHKSQGKTKAEKDRENEEMIRRVAEQEAKQAEKGSKKGWGFGGWFGGGKKESMEPAGNKPIKANLGEQSSFVYDPELKRWINKKGGAETTEAKKATPPPPRGPSTPPPMSSTPPPPPSMGGVGLASPPAPGSPRVASGPLPALQAGAGPNGLGVPPLMARSVSNHSIGNRSVSNQSSGPPSRPTTSMSNASSIDDLLSAAGPRKPGQKKARKGGRYIDVMAK